MENFAILMAIIVGSLGFLAYSGIQGSTSYYKTIPELRKMGNNAQSRHIRVSGNVQGDSIVREAGLVKFNLVEEKQILRVAYEGRDPLPDTFRDGAQALADDALAPITYSMPPKSRPNAPRSMHQSRAWLPISCSQAAKPAVMTSPMRSSL